MHTAIRQHYKTNSVNECPFVVSVVKSALTSNTMKSSPSKSISSDISKSKDKKNEEESNKDNTKNEEEGKSAGGAKNMKELLEKIYGARTKAAAETSVGKDCNQITCCPIQVCTFILHQSKLVYLHLHFLIVRIIRMTLGSSS